MYILLLYKLYNNLCTYISVWIGIVEMYSQLFGISIRFCMDNSTQSREALITPLAGSIGIIYLR